MSGLAVGASPPAALVIGIGNALRGDDGVGVWLVEELAEAWGGWRASGVELRTVQQLTPELALEMVQAERVLFVDAWRMEPGAPKSWVSQADGPCLERRAGSELVALCPPGPAAAGANPCGFGAHALEPATLVALAQVLYGWGGEAALLKVPAWSFGHGSDFSPDLLEELPWAQKRLAEWLGPRVVPSLE